jgi:hypothetical protein
LAKRSASECRRLYCDFVFAATANVKIMMMRRRMRTILGHGEEYDDIDAYDIVDDNNAAVAAADDDI